MGMFEGVMGSWFLRLSNVTMTQAILDLCGVPLDARYTVRAVLKLVSRIYLCGLLDALRVWRQSCDGVIDGIHTSTYRYSPAIYVWYVSQLYDNTIITAAMACCFV